MRPFELVPELAGASLDVYALWALNLLVRVGAGFGSLVPAEFLFVVDGRSLAPYTASFEWLC